MILSTRAALLPLCSSLLLVLPACPDPDLEPDSPDAGNGCASAAECAPGPCETATCEQGSCVYRDAWDATPCTTGAASGLCFAATCRTEYRLTNGLCLIADFADSALEQYSGPGFASEEQIRAALDDMESHWWWMSLGTHRFIWSIERIALDQPLSATAFSDWVAYRDEVVRKAYAVIDFDHYDTDGDGLLDAMYIIASNNELAADYLIGGMSRHLGANVFVDMQSSESVIRRAYGNFNHEVGHCLGLPDMYGPYGTIGYLSLMHDSWPVPANGFSVYDRQQLGWFTPTPTARSTTGIELLRADRNFSAIRIDTPHPAEYFLVEYRKRPESGYGSRAPVHDGLAIYHALAASTQQMDPPLLKLMAADGDIRPDTFPQVSDLWSPENASGPFVAQSYLGGDDLFRIENIERTDSGLRFDVVMLAGSIAPGPDLLANGSFESGTGAAPDGWATSSRQHLDESFGWDSSQAHDGSKSVRISMTRPNDAAWLQQVDGLTAGTGYLLCGWVRGDNVAGDANASVGASLCQAGTWNHSAGAFGTFDWRHECVSFSPDAASAVVGCRLGYDYSPASGTSWCDGLSLVALESAF
ncbi:MAG: hypothetical protein JXR83_14990 [Deltaproteobacteria bacterium]|nr:hypothetical protein [Deltaproteobacteria bacterium]